MNKKSKSSFSPLSSLRIGIYSAAIACTLLGLLLGGFIKKSQQWSALDEELHQVAMGVQKQSTKEKKIEGIKAYYGHANTTYVQNKLEPMPLLEKEQEALLKVIHSPGFCGNKLLEKRLGYLTSGKNCMQCQEHPLYTSSHFREVEVGLDHPVEASLADIENILKLIEDEEETKPLLQMKHFALKRMKPLDQNEVFEINFNILKREFLE